MTETPKHEPKSAPLPDDVAKAVRLLRINHWVPGNTKAADLIERLARQVPEGSVLIAGLAAVSPAPTLTFEGKR